MIERDADPELAVTAEFEDGIEWIAQPHEPSQRASHALRADDGVWVIDPLDAPGLDDRLAELGEVAGVAVCGVFHTRDAGAIATRHDVPVHVPEDVGRVPERVDAPVERFETEPGASGIEVRTYSPLPSWTEGMARYDGTLYVPDLLGSAPTFTVGDERLGVYLLRRPFPPRGLFADVAPDRLITGHGTAITEAPGAALTDALAGARKRFPRALFVHGPSQARTLPSVLR